MGRAASAGDNAAMESRWALSHRKVLNTQQWRPRAELHYTTSYGIEHTCNGRGRQSGVGRLTPNWVRVSLHQKCLSRSNLRDTTRDLLHAWFPPILLSQAVSWSSVRSYSMGETYPSFECRRRRL